MRIRPSARGHGTSTAAGSLCMSFAAGRDRRRWPQPPVLKTWPGRHVDWDWTSGYTNERLQMHSFSSWQLGQMKI